MIYLFLAFASTCIAFLCIRLIRSPGKIVVKQTEITWQSPIPDAKEGVSAKAEFERTNVGGSVVTVLSIESGCGCTTPSVDSTSIQPGHTARVRFEATPLPVGERVVAITVNTNSPVTPALQLTLRTLGYRTPPLLLQFNGDLTDLDSDDGKFARQVSVRTIEPPGQGLVPRIASDLSFLAFGEPRLISAVPYNKTLNQLITRSYSVSYHKNTHVPKRFSGEAAVVDPWDPNFRLTLRIQGKSKSPISVAPTFLNLSRAARDEAKFWVTVPERCTTFVITSENPESSPLEITEIHRNTSGVNRLYSVRLSEGKTFSSGKYKILLKADCLSQPIELPIIIMENVE